MLVSQGGNNKYVIKISDFVSIEASKILMYIGNGIHFGGFLLQVREQSIALQMGKP